MSLQRFEACLEVVLKFEGGLSDHPLDRGGKTNFGITQAVYNTYRKAIGKPLQDVAKITMAEVREIYYRYYWTPSKAEKMPPPLDLVVFDTAVNCGVATSARLLRRAMARLGLVSDWRDDVVRESVIATLWRLAKEPNKLKGLCYAYLTERFNYYKAIVERNPSQKVFFRGWHNRIKKLKAIVNEWFESQSA